MKEIPLEILTTQQGVEHVQNERQILRNLTESGVRYTCELIGTLKTDSSVCLVMEYVHGEVLTEFIKKRGNLSECEKRNIFRQVVDIMEDLHAQGIVYRDLKLTNLIVNSDHQVRIIDFGLSKIIGQNGRTRSICGTVHAMAPELVNPPEEGYGSEIDCWALGVLLYELFELCAPFGYKREAREFLESPGCLEFREVKKAEIQELITRLLTVDVNDRFTVADVKQHVWMIDEDEAKKVDSFWEEF